MSQSFSLYQLASPQQLFQARQAQGQPAAVAPQPSHTPPPAPQQFARVGQLLSPDQLMMNRPRPAQAQLMDPVTLFAQQRVQPSAPALSAPVPQGQVYLPPLPQFVQIPRPAVNVSVRPQAQAPSAPPSTPIPRPAVSVSIRPQARAELPALNIGDMRHQSGLNRLKAMRPSELKALGQNDKQAFFEALLPAAIESEKEFGVPAELTLAQAALESAWARSPIGGYNIFGIKGTGPAGKTSVNTSEYLNGEWVRIKDGFALYNNFYEAMQEHGDLFHNGYYDKAVEQFARDRSTDAFIDNIQGIYATDPNYSQKIKSIIEDYGLEQMVSQTGMV